MTTFESVNEADNPSSARALEISVVIPALNEEDSIGGLLDNLLKQTLPPAEIVVTDGGSNDRTPEIIQTFIQRGAPVKIVRVTKSMPGRARNLAAKEARCSWIAFTDAGITLDASWLEALANKAIAASADVVYGTYEPITNTFFTECAAIAYVPPPFAVEDGQVRPRSIVSALMRRQAWEQVGGFPEHLRSAEDLLFMNEVERAGFVIARTAKANARWQIQPNLWRTFKRFVAYSRNNIRAGLFHDWQRRIFLYYAIVAVSLLSVFVLGSWGFAVTLVLWFALLLARALKTLHQNRLSYPAGFGRNFARVLLLIPIIVTLDAAAFIGSIDWLLRDGGRGEHEPRG